MIAAADIAATCVSAFLGDLGHNWLLGWFPFLGLVWMTQSIWSNLVGSPVITQLRLEVCDCERQHLLPRRYVS